MMMLDKRNVSPEEVTEGAMTFRRSLDPFKLAEPEFKNLLDAMEAETGAPIPHQFADDIDYLMVLTRQRLILDDERIKKNQIIREITKIQNAADRLVSLLEAKNDNLNEAVYSQLTYVLMREKLLSENTPDPIYHSAIYTSVLKNVCAKAIENLQKPNTGETYDANTMKMTVAEELARGLDEYMGIKPTKYRDGTLCKIYNHFIKAAQFNYKGKPYRLSTPTDNFRIIKTAVDSYPNKEKFPLLNFL